MIYGLAQHIVKTELFELQLRSIPVIWLFSSMKVAKTSFKRLFFSAGRNEDGERLILCIRTCLSTLLSTSVPKTKPNNQPVAIRHHEVSGFLALLL